MPSTIQYGRYDKAFSLPTINISRSSLPYPNKLSNPNISINNPNLGLPMNTHKKPSEILQ